MTDNHYSMLVLWSEDDEAFLVHVLELPGCIAHRETREEALRNALIAIENWIDTAKDLNREIPAPLDLAAFEKQTAQQAQDVRNRFEQAVQKAVHEAVQNLVPQIARQFQNALLLQQQGGMVSLYRSGSMIAGGVLPTRAEDLELHSR
jgi:predicted RNase H-like HicB family nuclease